METYFAKVDEVKPEVRLIDAQGKILGRLATQIAMFLMGKHKPSYTPHVLTGDSVIVINAKAVRLTGAKEENKVYRHYTGYPSGLREIPLKRMREKHPERIISEAVRRMLPKNYLAAKMLKRLHVYAGATHKHQAQKPVETKLKDK